MNILEKIVMTSWFSCEEITVWMKLVTARMN